MPKNNSRVPEFMYEANRHLLEINSKRDIKDLLMAWVIDNWDSSWLNNICYNLCITKEDVRSFIS